MTRMVMLAGLSAALVGMPTAGFSASSSKPKEIVVVGSQVKSGGGKRSMSRKGGKQDGKYVINKLVGRPK
jgi:hypothetical protein